VGDGGLCALGAGLRSMNSVDTFVSHAAVVHLGIITTDAIREAYLHLVLSFSRNGFDLVSKTHPTAKNDVHFCSADGTRPYSLIANQEWVLFYFRQSSSRPVLEEIPDHLEAKKRAEPDEVTVRVRSLEDAEWVLSMVEFR
jgi:hypothetical protein